MTVFKNFTIFCLLLFSNHHLHGSTKCFVYGRMDSKYGSVKYFAPIGGIGNMSIASAITADSGGVFKLDIDVVTPTTAKFIIGQKVVWLLLQQNDTIHLNIKESEINANSTGWLTVENKNKAGIEYYNTTYNYFPSKKFDNLRTIFSDNSDRDADVINTLINKELDDQTRWLDSLKQKELITDVYCSMIKFETRALLASEVCVLSEKWYGENLFNMMSKKNAIINSILRAVNPDDPKFWNASFASSYYNTYLKYKMTINRYYIDTSRVLIDEIAYMELAPIDMQWYLWGRGLLIYYQYEPEGYDYCSLTKKYISLYGETVFSNYMLSRNVCGAKTKSEKKFIELKPNSFFNLFDLLPRNRYFIDLWATWCGPCKKEFENYNDDFYKFLADHKIKPLFISIDEPDDESKWKRIVETMDLRGDHLLADKQLQQSMKEILFNNEGVSIPRYLLISEKGEVLLDNAKRPSEGALRIQLLEALKKSNK